MKVSKSALSQFIGQDEVQKYLNRVVATSQISHAYLFTGPRGVGKTPAAIAFAQSLICERGGCGHCPACERVTQLQHEDLFLITKADEFGVEQARMVAERQEHGSVSAPRIVFVLDLTNATIIAQNALLKTLEEPRDDVVFILLADDSTHILETISSRAQKLYFHPLTQSENTQILLAAGFGGTKASKAAKESSGSYEIAESIAKGATLDYGDLAIKLLAGKGGTRSAQEIVSACEAIATKHKEKIEENDDDTKAILTKRNAKKWETQEKTKHKRAYTQVLRNEIVNACLQLGAQYERILGNMVKKGTARIDLASGPVSRGIVLDALVAVMEAEQALRFTNNYKLVIESLCTRIDALAQA